MDTRRYDNMPVSMYETNEQLGRAAANDLAAILSTAVKERGSASIILATGNSQLSFIKALRTKLELPWNKITVFHMDEYLGMPTTHTASFRRWMREQLTDVVHPHAFHGLAGDAPDIEAEMARYTDLLEQHDPVACVLGIGENGHLAFNDPPADFNTARSIHVATLAEEARRQQVGEGHFPTLADVPRQAITLTIPALLKPKHLLAVVPEARKASAVKAALEGPLTPDLPASILRTVSHTRLYLDRASAALL
ncbi:MAG: glucosamine-6-phosphate deaminase [Herpetosiphon sp.]